MTATKTGAKKPPKAATPQGGLLFEGSRKVVHSTPLAIGKTGERTGPLSPPAPATMPGARVYTSSRPIPRIGGQIPAGAKLFLTQLHPPRTVRTPELTPSGATVWRAAEIGPRGNFRTEDGRTLCDYPLDELAEWTGRSCQVDAGIPVGSAEKVY